MTEPARPWREQGRGVNSLVGGARRRTGPLEAVPAVEPPLEPLPPPRLTMADRVGWRSVLADLGNPYASRPPTEAEKATYARRRAGLDPGLDPWVARLYLLDADLQAAVPGPGEALRPGPGTAPAGKLPGPTGTDTAVSYG